MKFINLAAVLLIALALGFSSQAEDAPKAPAAPKPEEAKPAETKPAEVNPTETKPAETKPAETKPADASAAPKENDALIGEISKGPPAGGKEMSAKKAAKKGIDLNALTLHVTAHGEKVKGEKKNKGQNITLTATGDVLTQLTAFAEKNAHIKVTGTLTGETMAVKEVAEAPAEPAEKKKKNK